MENTCLGIGRDTKLCHPFFLVPETVKPKLPKGSELLPSHTLSGVDFSRKKKTIKKDNINAGYKREPFVSPVWLVYSVPCHQLLSGWEAWEGFQLLRRLAQRRGSSGQPDEWKCIV